MDDAHSPDDEEDYYSDEDEYGNYEEDYGSSAEYFNAYAVRRFDDGTQVLVSFSDDFNNDHGILKQILLSLHYSRPY
jgi:hypothetical protein